MYAYQDQSGPFAFDQNGSQNGPWNLFNSTLSGFRVDGGSAVPEPGTLVMLGSGALAIAGAFRRKLGL